MLAGGDLVDATQVLVRVFGVTGGEAGIAGGEVLENFSGGGLGSGVVGCGEDRERHPEAEEVPAVHLTAV